MSQNVPFSFEIVPPQEIIHARTVFVYSIDYSSSQKSADKYKLNGDNFIKSLSEITPGECYST